MRMKREKEKVAVGERPQVIPWPGIIQLGLFWNKDLPITSGWNAAKAH